jgi:elongation factor Ts
MAVDPAKVKELREVTGLPMMECKKALEKTGGDIEKAQEELRKSGLKAQEKLAGRAATEGRVGSQVAADGRLGVLVALRCETESVAKNEQFQKLLVDLVQLATKGSIKTQAEMVEAKFPTGGTVGSAVTELINKIRENITLGRFARLDADAVVQYVHFDQKKAAMVALAGGSTSDPKVAELGKDLCMHVVFNHLRPETIPWSLDRSGVDPKAVEKERGILLETAKNDPKNAKKPEEILKKIIQGQVDKFIAAHALLEQPYIRDPNATVAEHVKRSGTGVTVTGFANVSTDT